MRRNPGSPWNPADTIQVAPEEYEKQVTEWLRESGRGLAEFRVDHRRTLPGISGEYEFDAVARFSVLCGAEFLVVVECKRYRKPVEQEKVHYLHSRLREVGAHKGMMFSTSGFQKGALKYASAHGIATITFLDGKALYETKAADVVDPEPPPWVNLPEYAGQLILWDDSTIHVNTFHSQSEDDMKSLRDWLPSGIRGI